LHFGHELAATVGDSPLNPRLLAATQEQDKILVLEFDLGYSRWRIRFFVAFHVHSPVQENIVKTREDGNSISGNSFL